MLLKINKIVNKTKFLKILVTVTYQFITCLILNLFLASARDILLSQSKNHLYARLFTSEYIVFWRFCFRVLDSPFLHLDRMDSLSFTISWICVLPHPSSRKMAIAVSPLLCRSITFTRSAKSKTFRFLGVFLFSISDFAPIVWVSSEQDSRNEQRDANLARGRRSNLVPLFSASHCIACYRSWSYANVVKQTFFFICDAVGYQGRKKRYDLNKNAKAWPGRVIDYNRLQCSSTQQNAV